MHQYKYKYTSINNERRKNDDKVLTELVTNEVQNSKPLIKKLISHYQLVSAKNGFDVG